MIHSLTKILLFIVLIVLVLGACRAAYNTLRAYVSELGEGLSAMPEAQRIGYAEEFEELGYRFLKRDRRRATKSFFASYLYDRKLGRLFRFLRSALIFVPISAV
jgi:hypothetical protein